jgi:hypothetical protein
LRRGSRRSTARRHAVTQDAKFPRMISGQAKGDGSIPNSKVDQWRGAASGGTAECRRRREDAKIFLEEGAADGGARRRPSGARTPAPRSRTSNDGPAKCYCTPTPSWGSEGIVAADEGRAVGDASS